MKMTNVSDIKEMSSENEDRKGNVETENRNKNGKEAISAIAMIASTDNNDASRSASRIIASMSDDEVFPKPKSFIRVKQKGSANAAEGEMLPPASVPTTQGAPDNKTTPTTRQTTAGPHHPRSSDHPVLSHPRTKDPSLKSAPHPPMSYAEPAWATGPDRHDSQFSIEVVKSGVVVDKVRLGGRSVVSVGRLDACDVVLEHPTLSRYHAVFQYRDVADERNPRGWYLYDLGSTHGTLLNKKQIPSRQYFPLQVGHVVRFAASTRMFIIQGPPPPEEGSETDSVQQLKEFQERKLTSQQKKRAQEEAKGRETDCCTWGFQEDAVEEEEGVEAENPFAKLEANEHLHVEDPKKTLRCWFEREGMPLEYSVEEVGFGSKRQFRCTVELPIDSPSGEPVVAEASTSGKKKDAVVMCALHACRILDAQGLLRQARREGFKKKVKNWEKEDYYDSDEDIFLDRTGDIEKKRDSRMENSGKKEVKAETYESLKEKLSKLDAEISEVTSTLEKAQIAKKAAEKLEQNSDELDTFIKTIRQAPGLEARKEKELKRQLVELKKEHSRIGELLSIAAPAALPALTAPKNPKGGVLKSALTRSIGGRKIASRAGTAGELKAVQARPPRGATSQAEVLESEDDDDDGDDGLNSEEDKKDFRLAECPPEIQRDKSPIAASPQANQRVPNIGESEQKIAPGLNEKSESVAPKPKRDDNEPAEGGASGEVAGSKRGVAEGDEGESGTQTSAGRGGKRRRRRKGDQQTAASASLALTSETLLGDTGRVPGAYSEHDPDYAMWVPPMDQTGDGTTILNEKLGY